MNLCEGPKPSGADVIAKCVFAPLTTIQAVMDDFTVFDARRAWHDLTLRRTVTLV